MRILFVTGSMLVSRRLARCELISANNGAEIRDFRVCAKLDLSNNLAAFCLSLGLFGDENVQRSSGLSHAQ
jgi:hypothetical protein